MQVGNRRYFAAAACAGVALLAGGCGSSASSSSHAAASVSNLVDPVAKAATVSNAQAGYKMQMQMQMQSPALPVAITATGSGSFSPANRTGSMTLAMAIPGLSALLGSSGLTIQELIDGETFYMKLPAALSSKLPGGKPWTKLDLGSLAAKAGVSGLSSLFNNPASSNPSAILQYLKAASSSITKAGTATIDGQPTTAYKATIDLAKYPSLVPSADRAAAAAGIASLEKLAHVSSIPVEVWIDSHHLVRRMSLAFSETVPNTTQTTSLAMTMNMTDYGPQPTPAYPPASQVSDGSALLNAASSSVG